MKQYCLIAMFVFSCIMGCYGYAREAQKSKQKLIDQDDMHFMGRELHRCSANGNESAVQRLIEEGADVNYLRSYQTPLMVAQTAKIAEMLIKAGADVNAKAGEKLLCMTPLMFAKTEEIAEVLIKSGANVNARDIKGQTALMYARTGKIAEVLIKSGANVNDKMGRGVTALVIACIERKSDVVESLIKAGANVNITDVKGVTPLMWACRKSDERTAICLIKAGANINAQDNDGYTPLIYACLNSNFDIVYFLIKSKVDVNATDLKGRTALAILTDDSRSRVYHSRNYRRSRNNLNSEVSMPDRVNRGARQDRIHSGRTKTVKDAIITILKDAGAK